MCMKTSLVVLFLCLFLHACSTQTSAVTSSIPRKKSQPHDMIEENLKFKKFSRNGRVTICHSMLSTSVDYPPYKKNKAIKGESSEDCNSSPQKALQHMTKSKGSWWPRMNVREMDLHSTIFREEDFSETDYQPPHRKSPIHNK